MGNKGFIWRQVIREDNEGIIRDVNSTTISLTAGSDKNASFSLSSIATTDFLHIYVDSNDAVKEDDETNNYVFRAAVKPIKAYIDVKVDPQFSILNELIKEYISTFVEPTSASDADVVIIIGHPRVSNSEPFDINDEINCSGELTSKSYAGVVKSSSDFVNGYSGKPEVLVYGNRIEGDVAAVKRLISARSIFLDKGAYSRSYTSCVDDYDTLGISVMDLLSRNETKQHMKNNNIILANDVRKILFDNNFEVAVKPVKTLSNTSYGNSTELRIKNVNSDFSSDYVDVFGISDKPVVLSRGIHSNLLSWQDFARELTGEGFDAWLIEMVGGPYTDDTSADGCGSNCPNYTFADLKDFYWPASIAGIQKYSGKNKIDYVGFSLGCSAALESLESHQTGKNNSGYYFDYNTGQYKLTNLSPYPVDTFVGIGCPGNFTDLTTYMQIFKYTKDSTFALWNRLNFDHVTGTQFRAASLLFKETHIKLQHPDLYNRPVWPLLYLSLLTSDDKMSKKIYQEFYDWINDPTKPDLGKDVRLNNTLLIQGKATGVSPLSMAIKDPSNEDLNSDMIVPAKDMKLLCDNINSTNKYYVGFERLVHGGIGFNIVKSDRVKILIKDFLKNKNVQNSPSYTYNTNCAQI